MCLRSDLCFLQFPFCLPGLCVRLLTMCHGNGDVRLFSRPLQDKIQHVNFARAN